MSTNKIFQLIKITSVIVFSLSTLAACDSNSTTANGIGGGSNLVQSKVATQELGRNDNSFALKIGSGIDSMTNTVTSDQSCLDHANDLNNMFYSSPVTDYNFGTPQDTSVLRQILGIDVDGWNGGGRFEFSSAAKFLNDSKNTNDTMNLFYIYQYSGMAELKDLGYKDEVLKPSVLQILKENPTDFRIMCGDRYVEQAHAGIVLAVGLKLKFKSLMDKDRFSLNINGLDTVLAKIQKGALDNKVPVELDISVIQLGGEPNKLDKILYLSDSSGKAPSLSCNTSSGLDACNSTINSVINYSQTLEEQITKPDGSYYFDRLYYSRPLTKDYGTLGIVTNSPTPNKDVINAMQQLTDDYDKTLYDYQFVTHYQTALKDKLDNKVAEQLLEITKKLSNQIDNVYLSDKYNLFGCYRGFVTEKCLIIHDEVKQGLKQYKLTSAQENLVDYLETNSYYVEIINYYGGQMPQASDYKLTNTECAFVPVSSSLDSRFAIICDGNWLETADTFGVNITSGFMGSGLTVSGLNYFSVSPNNNQYGQWINYKDSFLKSDEYWGDGYFFNRELTITAPQFSTNTGKLEMIKIRYNPA